MRNIDLAKRVYDHAFKLDPIIRSILDTDVYKLLMLQTIWKEFADIPVTFSLINRSEHVSLARDIDVGELREQLDHARTVGLTKKERIWLAGNTFYGRERLFTSEFIEWLSAYRLPEYELKCRGDDIEIDFHGRWSDVTLWEIPVLSIISELRSRAALKRYGRFELDVIYSRAKARLWEKLVRLKKLEHVSLADFGSRRRHSFLWQDWCVQALREGLGERFIGTSNVLLAMEHDLDAIGTNAHELPMVLATLADSDEELQQAPYRVLESWRRTYDGNLLIVLPDTFGTTAFLANAPDWVADWSGFRVDSKDPVQAGEELLAWWRERGREVSDKRIIFSDGLDLESMEAAYRHFEGRVRLGFGWGTNLTNDFRECAPGQNPLLGSFSMVCKVTRANGRPTVKLSDNLEKSSGPEAEIQRYLRVFGDAQLTRLPVLV